MEKQSVNNFRINNNFNLREFQCNCCQQVKLKPLLAEKLQKLREVIDYPILVNSGFRCDNHNQRVGGSPSSYHLHGMAADIYVRGKSPEELLQQAATVGFNGLGLYNNHLHVDIRPQKVRW